MNKFANKIVLLFVLNAIVLLLFNAYYIMINVPPDGRWKFQIPTTSFFIIIYLIIFFIINKKLSKNTINHFSIFSFNIVLSVVFLFFAKKIEIFFQGVNLLYFRFIPIAAYLIIFGAGIIAYSLLFLFFEKYHFLTKDTS